MHKPTPQPRTCQGCGKSHRGNSASWCASCAKARTEETRAREGKFCRIPGCGRGAYTLTRMLCGSHAASDSRNKRQVQNTCRGCAQPFTSRDPQLYCPIQCRNTNRDPTDYERSTRTRQQRTYPYTCQICGAEGNGHLRQTACENFTCQCMAKYGADHCRVHINACANCGEWFASRQRATRMCPNPICQYVRARGSNHSRIYTKTCMWCSYPFTTSQPSQVRCSTACVKQWTAALKGDNPRPWRVHATHVYKRDSRVCHLCGLPTLKAWDPNDMGRSPSLDHIIPRSKGGSDEPSNLATAHFRCNAIRSDKPVLTETGQTMLFFG